MASKVRRLHSRKLLQVTLLFGVAALQIRIIKLSCFAYVPPTAAELVPKSQEMLDRVAQVKHELGDRLLSPQAAAELVDAGAMLIDVRTPKQIHAMTESTTPAKAIIDPLDDWVKNKAPTTAIKIAQEFGGRNIIVTCTAGPKSTLAWEFLKEHGIDAYVIDGGFNAWSEAGLPTQVFKFPASQLK
eukprot:TRINITY_DN38040_c0_g1_i2.p1 TRINITY_DN38040_c0_g1~~TRINITY_DN38040_c0_g1_i2.p1  ORF type:complete len:186 (+),score=43.37 TRINITY_DN38040_c0_g1_i2:116-673(+)